MAGFTGKKQIGNYLVTFKKGKQTSKIFNAVNKSTRDLRATGTGKNNKQSPGFLGMAATYLAKKYTEFTK